MYHLNGEPFSEQTPKQYFAVSGSNGSYQLNPATVVAIGGEAGFGIMTIDKNSASENTNGPYSIELKLDAETIYSSTWEKFSFANSRGINSHVDYPALIGTGRRIQKSFVEPGNPLLIYKTMVNNGLVNLTDPQIHDAQYVISDVAGNESVLNFKVRYVQSAAKLTKPIQGYMFRFGQTNELDTNNVKITIPKNSLYSDLNFVYSSSPTPTGGYSEVHHVHNRLIPVHASYTLSIAANSNLPTKLQSKALIVNTNKIAQGGVYESGSVTAQLRAFGSFYVALDTIPPRITPVNIGNGRSLAGVSRVQFKISDNLSGIKSFSGRIDGKWILMEYDAKTASLWHTFDNQTEIGRHDFQLILTDMKDNSTEFNASFFR